MHLPRIFCLSRYLLCVAILFPTAELVATEADVIVYGSTPGGFCAAIAAAREGANVILLEPSDHLGGMSTGGLSHCDSNQMVRSTLMGLFHEWHSRIIRDYTDRGLKAPYDPSVKDQSRWTFEPHVAMRVTRAMLDEAGVRVLMERYLTSVTKTGSKIDSLVTKNGTFQAKVFVDGTYEGDLMAAAGVDWTIGREGRDAYGESLAGKQYPKQTMKISGVDDQGSPLPLITTVAARDEGDEEAGDGNIMTYSFRLCLTSEPRNLAPMPKPAQYDPARFELARRALRAGETRVGFDLYPLPGKKLDGNNSIGGQLSIGLVGGGTHWHDADEAGRQAIWERHKQYTLELIHFLTTDPAVPAKLRDRYRKLGLCKDEFARYDHFSPALYVRESRRMEGLYVLSQRDILTSPKKEDAIAISSFPIDSHDCQRIALVGGGVVNEGTIFPVRRKDRKQGYAYQVPYRAILPKSDQCNNLLVPVALSCTHVGISSLRIEGAWMVIGQAAGVAAALSADSATAVQDLNYAKLRSRLLAQGQVLELPSDVAAKSVSPRKQPSQQFVRMFDGVTLDGWTVSPPQAKTCWSVRDGVIVGRGEAGNGRSYLTYSRDPNISDFEMKFSYRFPGKGNSGVSIRARKDTTGKRDFQSYHADLGHVGIGPGILGAWDFHTPGRREHRCHRGDRLVIGQDDQPTIEKIREAVTADDIHQHGWNEARVVAQSNRFEFFINGKLASEFTEHLPERKRLASGLIQLQVHDPGMEVQFRDLQIRFLGRQSDE